MTRGQYMSIYATKKRLLGLGLPNDVRTELLAWYVATGQYEEIINNPQDFGLRHTSNDPTEIIYWLTRSEVLA